MAGDYLPIRLDLPDDPAVIQMAATLQLAEDDVVGRLVRTWAWFNRHSADGHAPGVTTSWLDRYTGTPGWSEAMAGAGWLEITEDGLTIPAFDTWNDEAAKKRLKSNERKRKQREREEANNDRSHACPTKRSELSRTCPAPSVTEAGPHYSTDTLQDTTKTDHIRTSWKDKEFQSQVKGIARESFRGSPFLDDTSAYREDDRKDLLGIAAMHHSGQIRPQWFLSSLDAIHNRTDQKPVTAPVRLFKRILADRWPKEAEKRFGGFYKALFAVIADIPPELLKQRQPAGQEAGTTP